jgi:hypothetical protein
MLESEFTELASQVLRVPSSSALVSSRPTHPSGVQVCFELDYSRLPIVPAMSGGMACAAVGAAVLILPRRDRTFRNQMRAIATALGIKAAGVGALDQGSLPIHLTG